MPAPRGRAALTFFSAAESSAKALRIVPASGIATSFVRFVVFSASVLASSSRTCTRSPWRPTTVPHLPLCSAAPLSEWSSTRSPLRYPPANTGASPLIAWFNAFPTSSMPRPCPLSYSLCRIICLCAVPRARLKIVFCSSVTKASGATRAQLELCSKSRALLIALPTPMGSRGCSPIELHSSILGARATRTHG